MSGLSPQAFLGASIALMSTVSLIATARTVMMLQKGTRLHWDDLWLALGYGLFMIFAGLYAANTQLLFRLQDAIEGRPHPNASVEEDSWSMQKILVFSSSGLWFTLWSAKFSLLALYKRLMVQLPAYVRVWWFVVVFSLLVGALAPLVRLGEGRAVANRPKCLITSFTIHVTTCQPVSDWFVKGGCGDMTRMSYISIWQAWAVDVITDLMGKEFFVLLFAVASSLLTARTIMFCSHDVAAGHAS
ncbi:uncharacterized protein PG986_010107 [Apiospora aurea]|uniref:Uncharacterized protein n=1 Tax=Apiospora aurea TaxID=335848 RepID=A0ABR1Q9I5_9PEZI